LQVARLAGLPAAVVERARTILSELERSDRESPKRALVDDLPLFAAPVRAEPAKPKADALRETLNALDPDQMTPREALDALYRLKASAKTD
jgi:DNA mismatch repair protein MutS